MADSACVLDFRTNKPSDIISTLVSIYDSKDLFVKELQVLLAQRLLAIRDGKFEKEVRAIECRSGALSY
jgi:anaphase-promoting complex subunit 2